MIKRKAPPTIREQDPDFLRKMADVAQDMSCWEYMDGTDSWNLRTISNLLRDWAIEKEFVQNLQDDEPPKETSEGWWVSDARRPNGGPAFAHGNPEDGGDPGMSLRDWFAGQALVSMGDWTPNLPNGEFPCTQRQGRLEKAEWAYKMADAMLAARQHAPEGKSDG